MTARTRIKICGIKSAEMAHAAVEAGADAIGFVIDVPESPRSITLDQAVAIAATVPPLIMAVAVVKDPERDLAERWPHPWIQLHGNEDEDLAGHFARTKHVIKGFAFDPAAVMRWNDCRHIDALFIDGPRGGRGEPFDHAALVEMMPQISKPVAIAGGLNADNVAEAIRAVRPFAVDVSSSVESAPGVKDPELIRRFCEAVAAAI